jgi:hypothetical protein
MSFASNGSGEQPDERDNEADDESTALGGRAPGDDPRALERKAEALRREVDQLIAEAERRRHNLVARQIKHHPVAVAAVAGLLGAGVAAVTVLLVRQYRERRSLTRRALALLEAAARSERRPRR